MLVDIFYYVFLFLLGLAIGSFVNAWVWRTRENLRITRGRSMCPSCRKHLNWYDNIPLLSYVYLKARCRNCHIHIPHDYFLVELWMGIIFVLVPFLDQIGPGEFTVELIRDWTLIFLLTYIFVYDFKYREIRDAPSIPASILLFILSLGFAWQTWNSMLIGLLIGGGFFFLQYIFSKGKWVGGGDIRLGVFMGVILGWPKILVALLLAYICGALVSLALIISGRKKLSDETAFGTYLVVATIITMFFGNFIISWYISLI